jgi:hypothetical protein
MKIVKQFSSNDFAIKKSSPDMIGANWTWGLGNDGELYGRGSFAQYYIREWFIYRNASFGIPISEMKKIIKEFGHLVIFT